MSVQLGPGAVDTHTHGGVTVETYDAAAVVRVEIDLQDSNMVHVYFRTGTPAGQTFSPGPNSKDATVHVSIITGAYTSTLVGGGIGPNGVLPAGALTTLQGLVRQLRNGAESLAVNIGLLQGSMIAWT